MEMFELPSGYNGPNLDPARLRSTTRTFGPGVTALIAHPMPRDNSGVIAGGDQAPVIDAGINASVARMIQERAGSVPVWSSRSGRRRVRLPPAARDGIPRQEGRPSL
jgi:hypothetical protein